MKSVQVKPGTITYQIAGSNEMILKAKYLCHDVYLNAGYIEKAYTDNIIPYEHDASSLYIIAVNEKQEVVGTLRLAIDIPFKTYIVWKDKLYSEYLPLIKSTLRGNSFEAGALAVGKDCCALKISWGLYKTAYHYAVAMGLEYGIISMDCRALRSLEMLGWRVIKIGEPRNYFGSLTSPCIIQISKQSLKTVSHHTIENLHLLQNLPVYTKTKVIRNFAA